MNNHQFIPSILETKASASLEEQIQKELQIPDPEQSIAQIIENNEEKEATQNKNNQTEENS